MERQVFWGITFFLVTCWFVLVHCACEYPLIWQNKTWTDEDKGQITFGVSSMSGWKAVPLGTIITDWTCELTQGSLVLSRSMNKASIFGIPNYAYLCMLFTMVTDEVFYYYLMQDVHNAVGERLHLTPADSLSLCEGCKPTARAVGDGIMVMFIGNTTNSSDIQDKSFGYNACGPTTVSTTTLTTTQAIQTSTTSQTTSTTQPSTSSQITPETSTKTAESEDRESIDCAGEKTISCPQSVEIAAVWSSIAIAVVLFIVAFAVVVDVCIRRLHVCGENTKPLRKTIFTA